MTWRRAVCFLLLAGVTAFGSEAYFSPSGGIQNQIVQQIDRARSTIDIAVYSFTSTELGHALAAAHRRGVVIRVLRDASQSHNKHDENAYLLAHGIAVQQMGGHGRRGSFHDKFAIFDGKILETGSFNWTVNGERYNHENIIFFTDPDLIKAFQKEFEKLWRESRPIKQAAWTS